MNNNLTTPLGGYVSLPGNIQYTSSWIKRKDLYRLIWVRSGTLNIEVDHVPVTMLPNQLIALTPYHKLKYISHTGENEIVLFNSNFYCIYGHDDEVSCAGILFNGGSFVRHFDMGSEYMNRLELMVDMSRKEFKAENFLKTEMIRAYLKSMLICCTRVALKGYKADKDLLHGWMIMRNFTILVDQHYKEKKKVMDYAIMLGKSPKTISHLFSVNNLSSPLKIIHDRIITEAKRLALDTDKSFKEISYILGFEDMPSFSRFFKLQTGIPISEFRKTKREIN